ncbi:MAG: arylsulfotransferase family protein [Thermoanaerobaculia bacterium]|nr:arylsulfotransferase family protein [Thermoanaerobaculia bacterium]
MAGIVLAAALLSACGSPDAGPQIEGPPRGSPMGWALDLHGAAARNGEEDARTLSLPYVSEGARATGSRRGVTLRSPDSAAPEGGFYVSGHAPEAILLDGEGRILWRWRYPFSRAFPDRRELPDNLFWRRARLLPDGSVVALFQNGGLVRIDRRSRLLWATRSPAYNDLFVTDRGTILTLVKELAESGSAAGRPVLEDHLVELDLETGRERWRISILAALERSPWASFVPESPTDADILHSNGIALVEPNRTPGIPPFVAGTVLLSLREIDTVVLLDPERGEIVWARRGPWRAQHAPLLDDRGRLVLFDNAGGREEGARVVRMDLAEETVVWQFPPEGDPSLESPMAGAVQLLEKGHLLITESARGRALEVTPDREIVWEFRSPHRAGEHDVYVAYLFEFRRVPLPAWLPEEEP